MQVCVYEDCTKQLTARNQSGYCRNHWKHSPDAKSARKCYMQEYQQQNRQALNEASRLRGKAWYEANKDRALSKHKDWKATHKDEIRAANERWYYENLERARENGRKKAAKRRAVRVEAFVEHVDLFNVWCRDSGLCFLCGLPADKDNWHLAHIIPLSRGGEHSYINTAVSHPACNMYQGSRLLEELDIEAFLISREEQIWDH